ncbi:MAG: hypothetical protein LBR44_12010 [Clostridiales Family XIII bacterium]|jgi:hypothetical protein|nr:hypothetical protein [Clostridiales Family XIII bacterium]
MDILRYCSGALIVIALTVLYRCLRERALRGAGLENHLHFVVHAPTWRLSVSGDDLTLKPFLGSPRSWKVGEVTHLTKEPLGIGVWAGAKRLFTVNQEYVGSGRLVSYMIEKGVQTPEKIDKWSGDRLK